jgi:hypothetical protein
VLCLIRRNRHREPATLCAHKDIVTRFVMRQVRREAA